MAEQGYDTVIAIGTEPGAIYRDLFADRIVPESHNNAAIIMVVPEVDPKEVGVEFTRASEQGVNALYQHGIEQGKKVLQQLTKQD
jgi:hypothetical protein